MKSLLTILVTAIVNKDAPLTAVKQRTRQPLLKKSPTDKVFDLLALRIFSELHSNKYTVRQCVQFKKYLSNSPAGNAEAFLSASDGEVAIFIDDTLGIE